MKDIRGLLDSASELERVFVAETDAGAGETPGWSRALLLFHVGRWRERLVDQLANLSRGLPVSAPPSEVDALNAEELPRGAGLSLKEAAALSEGSMQKLIDLWAGIGDRPFTWYRARSTGEAIVRIGYFHPRNHMADHFIERGQRDRGTRVYEQSVAEMRDAEVALHTLGQGLYNLARVRLADGRRADALSLLEEALPMWPGLREEAGRDARLAALRNERRFQALLLRSES